MFDSVVTMGLLAKEGVVDDAVDRYQCFQFVEILKRYDDLKRLGLEHHGGIPASAVEFLN